MKIENAGNASKWKESLIERTISRKSINLMQLVYGKSETKPDASSHEEIDANGSDDDEFFKPKGEGNKKSSEGVEGNMVNTEDSSKFTNFANVKDWKDGETIESIRDRFVTGDWSKAARRVEGADVDGENDDDAPVFGEFEDLETGEKNEGDKTEPDSVAEERRLKKLALRAKFDAQYPLKNSFHFIYL